MPIGNFIFKYNDNNILLNNCEINHIKNNYSSYDYLNKTNIIYNINIKITVNDISCMYELNKMFNYFNNIHIKDNKLLIFNDELMIKCKNLIIDNLEMESIYNFYPKQHSEVKLNIISNQITILDNSELYHRKLKIDKILLKINDKAKTV